MIRMELPYLPPSANNAYFNLPGGGRALTRKGKKFKKEAGIHLVRTYSKELMIFKRNVPYGVAIRFFLPNVQNKTWPEKATTRYKRIDTSNRVKLIEDVLAEVADTNDSQHMILLLGKSEGPERTIIWAWELEEPIFKATTDDPIREFISM